MELNFNNGDDYTWLKYTDYKIDIIENKKYIVAEKEINNLYQYNPFNMIGQTIIDLINIGILATKDISNENLESKVLEFVTNYGLLGFMNDAAIGIADRKIILKKSNFITKYTKIAYEQYFKLFFPEADEKTNVSRFVALGQVLFSQIDDTYTNSYNNKELVYSIDYHESIEMIVEYAKYMYTLLQTILKMQALDYNTFDVNDNKILENLDVTCLNLSIVNDTGLKVRWRISSLKQVVDLMFAFLVASNRNTLNICKHCDTAFIAKNPKSEYCSYRCKNQANVYRSRAKNK